jgi:DNA-binding transcriptional ArsR family regulator
VRLINHPGTEEVELAQVLHALSDPVRLKIVSHLGHCEECACGQLEVTVSKSTLTHHLKVLRDAGLTHTRSEGVQRLVSLRREDLDKRFPGLLDLVFAHAAAASYRDAGKAEKAS